MKTSAVPILRRGLVRRWMLLVGCFIVGGAIAWGVRPRPLIVPAADDDEIVQRQDTAEAQYVYAMMLGTEEAWRSVPLYFPDDKTYPRRAMQNLALLDLYEYDFAGAMKLFNEFAQLNDAEVQFKAFGLAGQAVVLNHQLKYADSAEKLAQLWPLHDKLEGEMRVLVGQTLKSNREHLGNSPSLRRWTQWFRDSAQSAQPDSLAEPPSTRSPRGS